MKLTRKGRTWAAAAVTVLLGSALAVGLLVPAMNLDAQDLGTTVARALDAAAEGDLGPNYALDPDCDGVPSDDAAALIAGWTFTLDAVSVSGNSGTVTITAFDPEGPVTTEDVPFVLTDRGRWMLVSDGAC